MTLEESKPEGRVTTDLKEGAAVRDGQVMVVMYHTTVFDDHVAREMLGSAFRKNEVQTAVIIDTMRNQGSALIDICSRQVAETRVDKMRAIARRERCRIDVRLEVLQS